MTALAGIWRFGRPADELACRAMLTAQKDYGPHCTAAAALGEAAIGRTLFRTLPEDAHDHQPIVHPSGQWAIVADARIDNRDELAEQLGLGPHQALSDAALIGHAYDAWGAAFVDRLLGDFAVAIWSPGRQILTLLRDPTGQRPLHFHAGRGFAAFASMPSGLHALPEIPAEIDEEQLARFVADIPRDGPATTFRGVRRVEPGHIVEIGRDGVRSRNYWPLPEGTIRFSRDQDYVDALREQLDRAVAARLRGAGSTAAAHLSAGLDSSAVTATAAMIDRGRTILAMTSAPRLGFDGPVPHDRIGDESALAGLTAAMHPNIDHVVLRSQGASFLDSLARDAALHQDPVGHPCNQLWWSTTNAAAQERGASVMLTGEAGNLTLSAGGLSVLTDFVRAGRFGDWLREARAAVGSGKPRWRGVLAASFGPWMPRPLWRALNRVNSGYAGEAAGIGLLAPKWRTALADEADARARGGRPERDQRQVRWRLLQKSDPGNFRKGALAGWGIDERDPTADRRLAEFCLALPPEQLFHGGESRRLARLALADRLPKAILRGPRGYQHADWYETLRPDRLRAELAAIEEGPGGALLDIGRLRALVDAWPAGAWHQDAIISVYRVALQRAIVAGDFARRTADAARREAQGSRLAASGRTL